ncbi:MAG: arsenate reductase [Sutterella parvirubra]|uniref:ArsC family protein n=1 Tax=Sutterella parvirubra YIT 11816 TaxID=762967 RepID=H3KCB5_9BURK|nr:ArsC/Spx/MgsR family protein [Sutterella parvirubra]EHY32225.1 ArsC family protein [Sutterella parvirubra YIT 11816]MCI7708498.1 arsenate reductase [Sutterella parvirubra]MDR3770259.1 ArsC/Spx/MgsR family protein [Sutterella sp.]MDY5201024.1 ArsC/Spx/MgsR family protein [Sutterella parvirubra]
MIHLWGITRCSSVRDAIKALEAHGIEYAFHSFDQEHPSDWQVRLWVDGLGRKKIINPSSRPWRALDLATRERAKVDDKAAAAVLTEHLYVIRRPLVAWPDGKLTCGLADFKARLEEELNP